MPVRSRLAVLAASNVALGQRALLATALTRLGSPLDLLVADGFGRSYGLAASVAGRSLPALLDCGLWRTLEAGQGPLRALVTDVGNDLLYGADVATIAGWVDEALARLRARGAQVALAGLPLASLARLGPLRFGLLRRLFYPHRSPLDHARLRARAPELDGALRAAAARAGCAFVEPRADWYGFDPIHVRRGLRREAFETLLAPLGDGRPASGPPPLPASWRLLALPPERRGWFGRERRHAQPALRLADGSTLSCF